MALNPYWPRHTGFEDFFGPSPWLMEPARTFDLMPVLDIERSPFMTLTRSSPGYEINEDDNKFQISIDVPGVKAENMKVDLEQGGRVLHLSGGRKVKTENQVSETRFEKRFTIGDNVDTTKIAANLADGVLTVTAPKKEKQLPPTTAIPITEGPAPEKIEDEKKE